MYRVNATTRRLVATPADPAACHRRAERAAAIIRHRAADVTVDRTACIVCVTGWVNRRLVLALYWPERTR